MSRYNKTDQLLTIFFLQRIIYSKFILLVSGLIAVIDEVLYSGDVPCGSLANSRVSTFSALVARENPYIFSDAIKPVLKLS